MLHNDDIKEESDCEDDGCVVIVEPKIFNLKEEKINLINEIVN